MENENLFPMLHLAKEKGCLTSLTTNGIHLTEDFSRRLLTEELDLIVVSIELATRGSGKSVCKP